MKRPLLYFILSCIALLLESTPVWAGDNGDFLKQAEVLVKQAWNPGDTPPSAADRIDLLTKARKLITSEPDHQLRGRAMAAKDSIDAALAELKKGDPDNKVTGDLQDADRALRDAIEIAESH
jgi:hypothetical protein